MWLFDWDALRVPGWWRTLKRWIFWCAVRDILMKYRSRLVDVPAEVPCVPQVGDARLTVGYSGMLVWMRRKSRLVDVHLVDEEVRWPAAKIFTL